MSLFRNKYRNESARLPGWDYRNAGAYFVTIVTKNRFRYFGEIENGRMQYSPTGAIAHVLWNEIEHHEKKGIQLGEMVVMPDHLHGIIILPDPPDAVPPVGTLHATSLQGELETSYHGEISPKPGSISNIIRSYKSAVSKYAHRLGFDFAWQHRFHDRIIRDERKFENITNYIRNNPRNWRRAVMILSLHPWLNIIAVNNSPELSYFQSLKNLILPFEFRHVLLQKSYIHKNHLHKIPIITPTL
jgi:putative transposase